MTAETMMQNPNPRCWLITTPQGGDLHVCAADGWRVEEIIGGTRMDEKSEIYGLLTEAQKFIQAAGTIDYNERVDIIQRINAFLRAKEPGSAGHERATVPQDVLRSLLKQSHETMGRRIKEAEARGWAACREAAVQVCESVYLGDTQVTDVASEITCAKAIRAIQPPKE